jgi:hypothetical protein
LRWIKVSKFQRGSDLGMTDLENKKQAGFANIYAHLMDEVRSRLDAITSLRRGTIPPLPPFITYEIGYLQLRMVCELIAIGCLVAHGDIQATRVGKLLKAKFPNTIIDELEKLHQNFYPIPFTMVGDKYTDLTEGFLTKNDLLGIRPMFLHERSTYTNRRAV